MKPGPIIKSRRRTAFHPQQCNELRQASELHGEWGRVHKRIWKERRSAMDANERQIPRYVLEDLLFERRLQRNLSSELERVNNLLAEQIKLLEHRKELLSDVHEAVQRR